MLLKHLYISEGFSVLCYKFQSFREVSENNVWYTFSLQPNSPSVYPVSCQKMFCLSHNEYYAIIEMGLMKPFGFPNYSVSLCLENKTQYNDQIHLKAVPM